MPIYNQSFKKKTIELILKDDLCTGCGTCVGVCTHDAIKLNRNEKKGIYIPEIDLEICTRCGICYSSCPGYSTNFNKLNSEIFGKSDYNELIGSYTNCHMGYSTNDDIRYNSTSGGAITQLLIFLLEEGIIDGALVTRMNKENPLEPEPFIARNKDEVIDASKSKYCPVPANILLKEILQSKDEKFAVVGLPCHINGIRKAESLNSKLRESILLHIGIFCGTTKSFIGTEFQINRLGLKENDITFFAYRGEGWPGNLEIKLKNNTRILEPYLDYYDHKFCAFTPWRCMLCSDHTSELADISFGDAWLPEFSTDKIGTSVIISRNNAADLLLKNMSSKGILKVSELSIDKILQSQGMCRLKKNQLTVRIYFAKLFGKKVPQFDHKILRPRFNDYLITFWLYFWYYVSSRRYLWFLFDAQDWIIKMIKYAIRK